MNVPNTKVLNVRQQTFQHPLSITVCARTECQGMGRGQGPLSVTVCARTECQRMGHGDSQ